MRTEYTSTLINGLSESLLCAQVILLVLLCPAYCILLNLISKFIDQIEIMSRKNVITEISRSYNVRIETTPNRHDVGHRVDCF